RFIVRTLSCCHSGAPRSGEPGIHNHRPWIMDSGSRSLCSLGRNDGAGLIHSSQIASLIALPIGPFPMNNADLIIATLKANGITRGFRIPSGNVLPLMEAMRAGGVEFVLTAHEGSAGFAADVIGRMTGAPGFCLATL